MDEKEVLRILKGISDNSEDEKFAIVIKMVMAKINSKIREDRDTAPYADVLNYTAALMALLEVNSLDSSPTSIKAGEVSITSNRDFTDIKSSISENLNTLAPILKDKEFVFLEIHNE